ncbi:uncharacterized protein N0V89_000642 [Didymosphaeria variabile]|uniref:DUF7223 domain-containing protein n=1 Tax=Didymosphaeria variabile TaxID=1932322 RepID=A0A9W8XVL0_9PLEO|nr:uncharacterized protein N0V89_000642 [Didymosphaeria variabile]KAJ4360083.1 hypothetical protein N0V89_000642 [Didymosphaeria variabile]
MPRVRRQQVVSTMTSGFPTPSIPAPTATQTANGTSLDVNHPFIDKELPLPGDAGANIHIKCKNCSTFGEIDFAFASFNLRDIENFGDNNETGLQLGDFFEGGEASVVAKGLGARVELEIGLSNDGGFDIPLFEVPLLYALAIRGIGSAGLLYAPALRFAYTLNGTLNFTTGFEIAVPDESKILIDMTEPNNSSTSGFDATAVTPIPFQASVDVQFVQLSVALRHQIQIGFEFVNQVGVEVGVYLDLPKFGAEFAKKSGG